MQPIKQRLRPEASSPMTPSSAQSAARMAAQEILATYPPHNMDATKGVIVGEHMQAIIQRAISAHEAAIHARYQALARKWRMAELEPEQDEPTLLRCADELSAITQVKESADELHN